MDNSRLTRMVEDTLCLVAPCTHSSRGALVNYSCLTSGAEDSFCSGAGNFHGVSLHFEV